MARLKSSAPAELDHLADVAQPELALERDDWTHPMVGSEVADVGPADEASQPGPVSWLKTPQEPGCTPFVALWVRRAVTSDPAVTAWVGQHLDAVLGLGSGRRPETLRQLAQLIDAQFDVEGGDELIASVAAEAAERFSEYARRQDAAPVVSRQFRNGVEITSAVAETTPRAPTVTLIYPSDDGVASRQVLRDGPLGQLAMLADRLADRYQIAGSEVVLCILTDQLPKLSPVRLGLRFRRFVVDGVPVTATSRVLLEVDPQLDPAELARTFVQWQRATGVKPSPPSPKLVPLAAKLVDRLRLVPADRLVDSRSHPAELFAVGNKSWRLVPAVPWLRLARQVNYDPTLIRSRAAAIVHFLLPLDAAHEPRWLQQ